MLAQVRFYVIWNDPHCGIHFSTYMPSKGSLQQHFRKPLHRGPFLHLRRGLCVHGRQVQSRYRCLDEAHNIDRYMYRCLHWSQIYS